ncbi:MAG: hypothetical protein MUF22_08285 [Chitinispirillaceae bacterium]|jgi:hypothetical protein|nr:hypothetical protein [Chitinispirillaceae bacterium]
MTRFLAVPIILLSAASLFAQDTIDESALFADTSSIVDSATVVNTAAAAEQAQDKKSVGFSGELNTYGTPSFTRNWFDDPAANEPGFSSLTVGNALLDVRLVGGIKAFADMEASYQPSPIPDSATDFYMREMFVDANFKKLVYVRMGKQVLQWGRCNLWNPTDLVNVERKTFIAKMGHREGTYGVKMHIPYKTLLNFYTFVDMNDADTLANLPVSVKAEVLIGRTEMALSAWKRNGLKPVFGYDISSQLLNVLIAGEVSLRNGSKTVTLEQKNDIWDTTTIGDTWFPRAALSLTKFFPLAGVADRLMVSGEFYYNHIGYEVNVFDDSLLGGFLRGDPPASFDPRYLSLTWYRDPAIVRNLYEPNSYSRYYASLFTSISRFIIEQMTFSCNVMGNLNQNSYVLSTGVTYQSLHDFNLGISLIGFVGDRNTEYTFSGSGLAVRLQAGLVF